MKKALITGKKWNSRSDFIREILDPMNRA
jgi:hypothetical protein